MSLACNLLAQSNSLTCSMIVPSRLEGLDERERELNRASREGEGGQISVLARGREGTRKNELVLGVQPTYKALTAITKLPLSLIRA